MVAIITGRHSPFQVLDASAIEGIRGLAGESSSIYSCIQIYKALTPPTPPAYQLSPGGAPDIPEVCTAPAPLIHTPFASSTPPAPHPHPLPLIHTPCPSSTPPAPHPHPLPLIHTPCPSSTPPAPQPHTLPLKPPLPLIHTRCPSSTPSLTHPHPSPSAASTHKTTIKLTSTYRQLSPNRLGYPPPPAVKEDGAEGRRGEVRSRG